MSHEITVSDQTVSGDRRGSSRSVPPRAYILGRGEPSPLGLRRTRLDLFRARRRDGLRQDHLSGMRRATASVPATGTRGRPSLLVVLDES